MKYRIILGICSVCGKVGSIAILDMDTELGKFYACGKCGNALYVVCDILTTKEDQ